MINKDKICDLSIKDIINFDPNQNDLRKHPLSVQVLLNANLYAYHKVINLSYLHTAALSNFLKILLVSTLVESKIEIKVDATQDINSVEAIVNNELLSSIQSGSGEVKLTKHANCFEILLPKLNEVKYSVLQEIYPEVD